MTEQNQMTLQNHFAELRTKLIFCVMFFFVTFFASYFFAAQIYEFLLHPFLEISLNNENRRLIYTSPAEAFITYLKLSFYSALFFSFPVFASQFYLFISPGLYKKEKKNTESIFERFRVLWVSIF